MANYKRRHLRQRRSACGMCKPNKEPGGGRHQGPRPGRWVASTRAALDEREQRDERLPDFAKVYDVWQGLPCPDDEHRWGPSDLAGPWSCCRRCGADRYDGERAPGWQRAAAEAIAKPAADAGVTVFAEALTRILGGSHAPR